MSLADELLADLEELGDELGDKENDQQEDQIMEATEGLSEATGLQSQSVVALAQLANSDRLQQMIELIDTYLEDPRTERVIGPVEADPEYQLIVDSNNILVEIDNEISKWIHYVCVTDCVRMRINNMLKALLGLSSILVVCTVPSPKRIERSLANFLVVVLAIHTNDISIF
jgi:hypothetical protein